MGVILNNGQEKIRQAAVNWYKNSSEQVFEFTGEAGTGKTVTIVQILRSLGLKAHQFMPMAYTGKAALVMRSRGFTTSRSIHSSLYEMVEVNTDTINTRYDTPYKKSEFRLKQYIDPAIDLFFIDEGYMVPEFMKKDILSFGKKVIVCGDCQQLPPIGDKPGFLTGYGIHRLDELMRQSENNAIVYLARRAAKGLPIHAGRYGNQVLVINDDEFVPEMIGYADVILTGTNRTRSTLNNYIRQLAGFNTLTPVVGERVICRNNNWNVVRDGIALTNGLDGTVVSYPDASAFNGRSFKIDFLPDMSRAVFDNIPVNYKYFTSPYDERQSMKDDFAHRKYLEGEFFEYAYSLTTHLSQGSEYNNGIYVEEFLRPQMQNQLNYTAITRFKNSMIYIKKKNKYFYIPQH